MALVKAGGGEGDYLADELLALFVGGRGLAAIQVFALEAVTFKPEHEEVAALLQAAQAYVVGPVNLFGVALFDLLDVVQAGVGAAFGEGEGAVGKVEEDLAALHIVGREGAAGVAAFGGCGQVPGLIVCCRF